MLFSRSSLILLWLVVSNIALADEPRRVIDPLAVQVFIESQRTEQNGPGKVLARNSGHFDGDSFPDKLVVYTYEHGSNHGEKAFGMFVVAFLTERFHTKRLLMAGSGPWAGKLLTGCYRPKKGHLTSQNGE